MDTSIYSRVLVAAIAVSACSSASQGAPTNGTSTPRTSLPTEVVGSWTSGTVSSSAFYDPGTGSFKSPSGTGVAFTFTSDGAFTKAVLLQQSMYGCTSRFLGWVEGTATADGTTLSLYPTKGKVKSEDNCVADNNYERADDPARETIKFERGTDEYGNETLWLAYPDGNPSAFHRDEGAAK